MTPNDTTDDDDGQTRRMTIDVPDGDTRRGSRDTGLWGAFTARFKQSVETTSKSPGVGVHRGNIDRVQPPENLEDWREIPKTTPIVRKALTDFISDVTEPGYRIETDEDTAKEFLEDHWCPQAAIIGGEKHNDLMPFLRLFLYEKWRGGDGMAEHVRADADDTSSPITGLHLLNPAHIEFVTYEDKNILVDPEPDPGPHPSENIQDVDAPQTVRGEAAAYVQYGDGAVVTNDREAVPLSQNDVTRSALDPPAGELRGHPPTATIATDVTGFKNILRDKEEAIKTKAYGLWKMAFDRETYEYTDVDEDTGEDIEVTEIIEWDDDEQDELATEIEKNLGPGSILTHDGEISLDRLDGEVPDLIDDLEFYVSNILAPLPTPKYIVGFEGNINQFVTEGQGDKYDQLVDAEREDLERTFTDTMRRVIEHNLVENSVEAEGTTYSLESVPDDLTFKVEPPDEESPVMSLEAETIDKMSTWATAFKEMRGNMPADSILDMSEAVPLILQLPEDAVEDLEDGDGLDDLDPRVRQAAEDMGLGDGPPGDGPPMPPGADGEQGDDGGESDGPPPEFLDDDGDDEETEEPPEAEADD